MSGIKGFPSQEKLVGKLGSYDWQQTQTQMEFVTAQKSSSKKIGLDTVGNGVFRTTALTKSVTSVATELDEQKRVLISTAHGALPGDMIRFEGTSANPHFEAAVLSCPDANTMILGSVLPSIPVVSDEFFILRYITSRFSADGSQITSQGPLQFVLDNATVEVTEDTGTPANNKPLPVKLMGTTGPINITAGDLNVQLSDQGANFDVTRIGDGTNRLGITASNEAKVSDATLATAMTTLNAKDFATSAKQDTGNTSLSSIDGKFTTLNAKDFATQTTLAAIDTKLGGTIAVSGPLTDAQLRATAVPVSGTFWQVTQPISAAALPLPADAATETTLSAASAKLPATLGQKAMAASMAVVVASDQTSIPTLIKGSTKVGLVRNDYTSTAVTTGAYVQLIASTAALTNTVEIFDSSGETLVFATGAAASEVDQFYINPGGNGQISFSIPSGTRISIKAVSATASVGYINLNLYS